MNTQDFKSIIDHRAVILFLAISLSVAWADDATASTPLRYAAAASNYKTRKIAQLEDDINGIRCVLRAVQRGRVDRAMRSGRDEALWQLRGRVTVNSLEDVNRCDVVSVRFANAQIRQERLDNLNTALADATKQLAFWKTHDVNDIELVFSLPLEVGQVGKIGFGAISSTKQLLRLINIVDGQNMICEFTIDWRSVASRSAPRESRFLSSVPMRYIPQNVTIWLSGIPTAGLVDNQQLDIKIPLEITGTESYLTPINTRESILRFEPCR